MKVFLTRVLSALFVLVLVSLMIFAATQILPGDAAQAILGRDATPERLEALRRQLNLDQGMISQYLTWFKGIVILDFGTSLSNGQEVATLLAPRLGNSMILVVLSSGVAIPLSVVIGTIAAHLRDGIFDNLSGFLTLMVSALPEFVLATTLVLLFSTGLFHLFPATAVQTPVLSVPTQMVLPTLTLALAVSPYMIRMARGNMIEVLETDYIQHARLSGVSRSRILIRHALPNTLAALVQVVALQLAYLAGGVIVVEYVFAFPGIGTALVDAVANRDLPVIQAICLFIAAFYIVVNLITDGISMLVNPRVRHGSV